jgi:hypothetical protein
MFGKEAAELLNYVECFPNGFRKGTKMIKACADAKLEGFPTWVINGQVWIFKCIELSLFLDQKDSIIYQWPLFFLNSHYL